MISELTLKESLPCNFYEEERDAHGTEQDIKISLAAQKAIQTQAQKHHHKHRSLGKKISHCWKKHKKAIIITTVVIAVVVVVAVTAGAAAAAPAVAGGVAGAAAANDGEGNRTTPPPAKPQPPTPPKAAEPRCPMKVVEIPRDPRDPNYSPYALPEFTYVPDYNPMPERLNPDVVLRETFDEKTVERIKNSQPQPTTWNSPYHPEYRPPQITPQPASYYPVSEPSSKATEPFSIAEFSVGVAKGLPRGLRDSAEGCLEFACDMAVHPIDTSKQLVESIAMLAELAKQEEWKELGKALSPELHQLITEWDTLPSEKRGELTGYALGKHGGDFLAPGAVAKIAKSSVEGAKELMAVSKNLTRAREAMLAEMAGTGEKIAIRIEEIASNPMHKIGSVDPTLPINPDDLLKRPGWKETTHPEAAKHGHRTFINEDTGEILRHDRAKPNETGHKAHDHYHRQNPEATGKHDEYLDGQKNPVRDQSDPSHIYPPEGVWWKQE